MIKTLGTALGAAAIALTMATGATVLATGAATAGPIDRACRDSANGAASPQLCGCIQGVADLVLSGRDQRQAARMFRKPDMAQDVKMSKSRNDERFWQRYSQFGSIAQQQCS